MKATVAFVVATVLILVFFPASSEAHYGTTLCRQDGFSCNRVKKGDTWEKLFPVWNERNIVKRVNRMNVPLKEGVVLAIPRNMEGKTAEDFSPFPKFLPRITEKTVIFSLAKLYFAAYDATGRRLITGPIAAGRNCPGKKCLTPTGTFRFSQKYGPHAVSTLYPIKYKWIVENGKRKQVIASRGGAKTPYFMAIVGDVGSHAFAEVPGFNTSNGCIRMFFDDARWLNQRFVEAGSTGRSGTLAIIMDGLPK